MRCRRAACPSSHVPPPAWPRPGRGLVDMEWQRPAEQRNVTRLQPGAARKGGSMAETVLVTGGTGFVAGWCIIELLQRGYAVRTTVRSLSKEPAVRAAVASAADSGDLLTVFAADL